MSFRAGLQPLNIGYINNNEEPLLFSSVNRPEVERLVLPTEWIEAGVTVYGDVFNKINLKSNDEQTVLRFEVDKYSTTIKLFVDSEDDHIELKKVMVKVFESSN